MRMVSMYFGHDANVTLLEDGEVVALIEKERVTRKKHDAGLVDIQSILDHYGWSTASIDLFAFNPKILDETFAWLITDGHLYKTRHQYGLPNWSGAPYMRHSEHTVSFGGINRPGFAVDHHLAHAAGAAFASPFETLGAMTVDGGGDARGTSLAMVHKNRIEAIEYGWGLDREELQCVPGYLWDLIGTQHFGMKKLEGAGKLMGLASYGTPQLKYMRIFERAMYFHPYAPPRNFIEGIPTGLDPHSQVAQDICASLQEVTVEVMLQGAARLKELYGVDYAAISGGCAMNCIANTAIHQSGLFQDTYVPAQPHDGGLSLGQALYVWHHVLDKPRVPKALSPYLGMDAGSLEDSFIPDIIEYLAAGKSVGLCYGKAESGPRALGHRSILLDPRLPDGKDRLNNEVKHREWFRPFAPMVLGEDAGQWGVPSKYMSYIVPTKAEEVPAVTHVDGTSRPQIVDEGDDAFLTKLLRAWKERTGCSLLLNTSFNCQEPLVNTVEEAHATWRRTGLDVLVTKDGIRAKLPE